VNADISHSKMKKQKMIYCEKHAESSFVETMRDETCSKREAADLLYESAGR